MEKSNLTWDGILLLSLTLLWSRLLLLWLPSPPFGTDCANVVVAAAPRPPFSRPLDGTEVDPTGQSGSVLTAMSGAAVLDSGTQVDDPGKA